MNRFAALFLAMTLTAATPDLAELTRMTARFAPVELRVDSSQLSPGDRQALDKLVEAARVIDSLFLTQVWSGNAALRDRLAKDTSPLGKARLHYFDLNKGPWSDLDDHAAFLPSVPPKKLSGANFYPEDMTKEEFEAWVKTLPTAQQEKARGFFTVIRRANGKTEPLLPKSLKAYGSGNSGSVPLSIVPYSKAYERDLTRLSRLLNEAAALTSNASLKDFLQARA